MFGGFQVKDAQPGDIFCINGYLYVINSKKLVPKNEDLVTLMENNYKTIDIGGAFFQTCANEKPETIHFNHILTALTVSKRQALEIIDNRLNDCVGHWRMKPYNIVEYLNRVSPGLLTNKIYASVPPLQDYNTNTIATPAIEVIETDSNSTNSSNEKGSQYSVGVIDEGR